MRQVIVDERKAENGRLLFYEMIIEGSKPRQFYIQKVLPFGLKEGYEIMETEKYLGNCVRELIQDVPRTNNPQLDLWGFVMMVAEYEAKEKELELIDRTSFAKEVALQESER